MKIVVGGGIANGNGSIALGVDDTDATIFEDEVRDFGLESFSYDSNNDAFISPNYQPQSLDQCNTPSHAPLGSEIPTEKSSRHKRSRSEYGGSSNSIGTNNQVKILENLSVSVETIAINFEKISNLMEKRERDKEMKNDVWGAIKEIPNLEDKTCFMIVDLLNTKAKEEFFLKMSPEGRLSWINFKLGYDD